MAEKALPTPELLRQLLRYEQETGKLYWRERSPDHFADKYRNAAGCAANWNSRWAGKEAFTSRMPAGHLQGRIGYVAYLAHRVIWAMHYGEWPNGVIDHINHDPADNRIENLRDVRQVDNQKNHRLRQNNVSGATGVARTASGKRWVAKIKGGGKPIHLGTFDNLEDAIAARRAAEVEYGYHPNHGR